MDLLTPSHSLRGQADASQARQAAGVARSFTELICALMADPVRAHSADDVAAVCLSTASILADSPSGVL
jgi:hypothetical protein